MLTHIPTPEEVIEALEAAVAERGRDYVYVNPDGQRAGELDEHDAMSSCHYVHGDKPGCIVGYVLHSWGVPLSALAEHEGAAAQQPINQELPYIVSKFPDTNDKGYSHASAQVYEIARILGAAQGAQDSGSTWQYALEAAKSVASSTSPINY